MIAYKIPIESSDYRLWLEFVTNKISMLMDDSIKSGDNRILIHTNLKRGLPLENINKVAGPFVEAWALERFEYVAEDNDNSYQLINVEPGARLDPYDIILQFKKKGKIETFISANMEKKNGLKWPKNISGLKVRPDDRNDSIRAIRYEVEEF